MEKRKNSSSTSSTSSLRIWLLAGVSSVALTALVVAMTARSVEADARLKPAMPSLTAPAANATPASLAPQPSVADKQTDDLHGVASWYGKVFNGNRTASGERFNMYALTACHPTLPFGSVVRVVNLDNQKSVVVRINDRGILDEGRIIDLSYAAARRLSIVKLGLAHVDVQVISLGHPHKQL
jgi:rare lipoprotein A